MAYRLTGYRERNGKHVVGIEFDTEHATGISKAGRQIFKGVDWLTIPDTNMAIVCTVIKGGKPNRAERSKPESGPTVDLVALVKQQGEALVAMQAMVAEMQRPKRRKAEQTEQAPQAEAVGEAIPQ